MTTPSKPVFARLSNGMTRAEIKANLIAALTKSGFNVKPPQELGAASEEHLRRLVSQPLPSTPTEPSPSSTIKFAMEEELYRMDAEYMRNHQTKKDDIS